MSTSTVDRIREKLAMLGLACDEVPLDRRNSAISALACFPMYMVANVHGWTADRQFKIPLLDIPGSESLRESVAIGAEEGQMSLAPEHAKVVGSMLTPARAPDRVVYEYALETLRDYLALATPQAAEELRTAVARMVVAVSKASGKSILGVGEKITPAERACIDRIADQLQLAASSGASAILKSIESA